MGRSGRLDSGRPLRAPGKSDCACQDASVRSGAEKQSLCTAFELDCSGSASFVQTSSFSAQEAIWHILGY